MTMTSALRSTTATDALRRLQEALEGIEDEDVRHAAVLAADDVEAAIEDIERDLERTEDDLHETEMEAERLGAKADENESGQAEVVRYLHDRFRHRGPVYLCRHRECDEAVSFLRSQGVKV